MGSSNVFIVDTGQNTESWPEGNLKVGAICIIALVLVLESFANSSNIRVMLHLPVGTRAVYR